ncbi:MAG: hypothetical protein NTZ59_10265, partial [Bacteroidetes bacterium]|nr:hypothetical protein [Bacteroidota bacterium]
MQTTNKQTFATGFVKAFLLAMVVAFAGFSNANAQTYLSESFEGTWFLNGNSSTAYTATGPNAPSGWKQTRVLNDVVPGACATTSGPHDWGQMVYGGTPTPTYTAVNFAGTSTGGCLPYSTGSSAPTSAPPNGSNVLWFFDGGTSTGNTRRIETPLIDLSTSATPLASFSFSYGGTGVQQFVGSFDGGITWASLGTISPTTTGVWATRTFAIPVQYRKAGVIFGFQIASSWGSNDVFIDNFTIAEGTTGAPAAPTTFSSSAVTASSATITWVDNSTTETSYNVYRSNDNVTFYLVGSVNSTTTAGTGGSYSLALSGLTGGSSNYIKVVSVVTSLESSTLNGTVTTNSGTLSGTRTVGSGGNYSNLTLAFA